METETKTDNELIAGFDDRMSYHVPGNTKYDPYWKRFKDSSKESILAEYRSKHLQYHTSWDWLMPAWVKFLMLLEYENLLQRNFPYWGEWYSKITGAIIRGDIAQVHQHLSDGIKWYNNQKENGNS